MNLRVLLMLLVFNLATLSSVFAEEGILNKLLAPGPQSKAHAELEETACLKCHDAGKGVPDSKCLDCHKEIRPFVERKSGFHGLTNQSCRECHSEHKGRDYNSIAIDEKKFDHGKATGYKLAGKHAEIRCVECHTSKHKAQSIEAGKIRYFGNQASCVSCHKKDDVHFFKGAFAQKDCNSCHSLDGWKVGLKFDHKVDAKYELVGKHETLKCAECHNPDKKSPQRSIYEWSQLESKQCLSCHKDHHNKNLSPKFRGGNCVTCHGQDKWPIKDFDHDVTKYHLGGKHAEAKCTDCHVQKEKPAIELKSPNFKFTGLSQQCLSCHKDYHYFGKTSLKPFGPLNQCQVCHSDRNWTQVTRFEHNLHTQYRIDGAHLKLNCLECHVTKPKDQPKLIVHYKFPQLQTKTCETCHDSPHRNEFSRELLKKACTECHVTKSWYDMKNGKGFDHNKTRFALDGAHATTKCSSCHGESGKQNFKFPSANLKFCIDCHQNIHKSQFSKAMNSESCTQCHSTSKFAERLRFDHNQRTHFQLQGAHQGLKCADCHTPTKQSVELKYPNISREISQKAGTKNFALSQFSFPNVTEKSCLSCHSDYHKGQLGADCLSCHNVEKWSRIRFDHNRQSTFALRFKHEEVKCSECHKPKASEFVKYKNEQRRVTHYKPISAECATCHKDVHRGEFGNRCSDCHSVRGWNVTKDFHKNFTLTGVHFTLQCNECHTNGRKLAGASNYCVTCHAKDDVHNGTLPDCKDCHRQHFWEVTGFKHSLTLFPLRGAHRTLDCMECHRTGTYKGLSPQCASCHLPDALQVTSPNHSGFPNLNSCNECHRNQFSWK